MCSNGKRHTKHSLPQWYAPSNIEAWLLHVNTPYIHSPFESANESDPKDARNESSGGTKCCTHFWKGVKKSKIISLRTKGEDKILNQSVKLPIESPKVKLPETSAAVGTFHEGATPFYDSITICLSDRDQWKWNRRLADRSRKFTIIRPAFRFSSW